MIHTAQRLESPREEAAHHTRGDGTGDVATREGAACQVGGLAEFVTPGKGEGVRDGEGESDG